MKYGRKIAFDSSTGEVLADTGEREGAWVSGITDEQMIRDYKVLSERNRESFEIIELEYGAYRESFNRMTGFKIDRLKKIPVFSFPDPNIPDSEPIFTKSLEEQLAESEAKMKRMESHLQEVNNSLLEFIEFQMGGF